MALESRVSVVRDQPRLAVPVGSDDHIVGPDSAGITLVEYGDLECSYCAQAAPVVRELRRLFGDNVRFVFRNMPLTELHPHAERAAEAAEAAALQRRSWEMHHLLFEHRTDLSDAALLRYAVERDVEGGTRSGVTGTPTFFDNGMRYEGSWGLEPFATEPAQLMTLDCWGAASETAGIFFWEIDGILTRRPHTYCPWVSRLNRITRPKVPANRKV